MAAAPAKASPFYHRNLPLCKNVHATSVVRRDEEMVIEIKDQDFDQEVLKSSLPVLVDFWAPWCGPCRQIAPVVDKLSEEYKGKLKFCKVNVDENHDTASKYHVMSIPTLILFKKGQLVEQTVGGVSEKTLRSKLQELL
jgi:thioredoxin